MAKPGRKRKLTPRDVVNARGLAEAGFTNRQIAEKFDVSVGCVQRYVRRGHLKDTCPAARIKRYVCELCEKRGTTRREKFGYQGAAQTEYSWNFLKRIRDELELNKTEFVELVRLWIELKQDAYIVVPQEDLDQKLLLEALTNEI